MTLKEAIELDDVENLKKLLSEEDGEKELSKSLKLLLRLAAEKGNPEIMQRLVEEKVVCDGAGRSRQDGWLSDALFKAAAKNHLGVLNILLELPTATEALTENDGVVGDILGFVAQRGYVDIMDRLLKIEAVRKSQMAISQAIYVATQSVMLDIPPAEGEAVHNNKKMGRIIPPIYVAAKPSPWVNNLAGFLYTPPEAMERLLQPDLLPYPKVWYYVIDDYVAIKLNIKDQRAKIMRCLLNHSHAFTSPLSDGGFNSLEKALFTAVKTNNIEMAECLLDIPTRIRLRTAGLTAPEYLAVPEYYLLRMYLSRSLEPGLYDPLQELINQTTSLEMLVFLYERLGKNITERHILKENKPVEEFFKPFGIELLSVLDFLELHASGPSFNISEYVGLVGEVFKTITADLHPAQDGSDSNSGPPSSIPFLPQFTASSAAALSLTTSSLSLPTEPSSTNAAQEKMSDETEKTFSEKQSLGEIQTNIQLTSEPVKENSLIDAVRNAFSVLSSEDNFMHASYCFNQPDVLGRLRQHEPFRTHIDVLERIGQIETSDFNPILSAIGLINEQLKGNIERFYQKQKKAYQNSIIDNKAVQEHTLTSVSTLTQLTSIQQEPSTPNIESSGISIKNKMSIEEERKRGRELGLLQLTTKCRKKNGPQNNDPASNTRAIGESNPPIRFSSTSVPKGLKRSSSESNLTVKKTVLTTRRPSLN